MSPETLATNSFADADAAIVGRVERIRERPEIADVILDEDEGEVVAVVRVERVFKGSVRELQDVVTDREHPFFQRLDHGRGAWLLYRHDGRFYSGACSALDPITMAQAADGGHAPDAGADAVALRDLDHDRGAIAVVIGALLGACALSGTVLWMIARRIRRRRTTQDDFTES